MARPLLKVLLVTEAIDVELLARNWITYHESDDINYFWAVEIITELILTEPQSAWAILKKINKFSKNHALIDYLDGILGAGLLEDLIHGEKHDLAKDIIISAGDDARLKKQLSYMYIRDTLSRDIKYLVTELLGR